MIDNGTFQTFDIINSKVRRLSHIRRYSSLPVIRPENVAEHSFWCAAFAYIIAIDMRFRGFAVLPDIAVRKAVFHDIEESMTGDILRSFKYSTPAMLEAVERSGAMRMEELCSDFGVAGDHIHGTWSEAKDGPEGDIVAFCDLLCVISYIREERSTGNMHLDGVAHEVHGYINEKFLGLMDGAFHTYIDDLYPNQDPLDIFREEA